MVNYCKMLWHINYNDCHVCILFVVRNYRLFVINHLKISCVVRNEHGSVSERLPARQVSLIIVYVVLTQRDGKNTTNNVFKQKRVKKKKCTIDLGENKINVRSVLICAKKYTNIIKKYRVWPIFSTSISLHPPWCCSDARDSGRFAVNKFSENYKLRHDFFFFRTHAFYTRVKVRTRCCAGVCVCVWGYLNRKAEFFAISQQLHFGLRDQTLCCRWSIGPVL